MDFNLEVLFNIWNWNSVLMFLCYDFVCFFNYYFMFKLFFFLKGFRDLIFDLKYIKKRYVGK